MEIDGQGEGCLQVEQTSVAAGHGHGNGRCSGSHSTMEPTNITVAGRRQESPLSLNGMLVAEVSSIRGLEIKIWVAF
uniref:Uncharacterized protein n=1 Tax=Oryza glumipatula TaxID=40148 RepID=A0A0E0AJ89_9ORYZ